MVQLSWKDKETLCLLDYIDTIKTYKDMLTKKESNITNFEDTARILLRKNLRATFPNAVIRKNKDTYSVKLTDEELIKTIEILRTLSVIDLRAYFSEDLCSLIEEKLDLLSSFFNFNNTMYNFRFDNQSFFIYVTFKSLFKPYYSLVSFEHGFEHDLYSRKIKNVSKIGSLFMTYQANIQNEIDDPFTKVLILFKNNPRFVVSEYRNLLARLSTKIDQDFLNYYFLRTDRNEHTPRELIEDYAETLHEEEKKIEDNAFDEDTPNTFFNPYITSLDEEQPNVLLTESHEQEPNASNAFLNALQRVRENR